jgi:hypothetical protein
MSKKIIGITALLIITCMVLIVGCSKNTTLLIDNSVAITTPVSFSKDVQPILTKSCATSGCHSGSVAPNLSAATAYTALQSGSFINTTSPEKSDVYLWLTGKKSATMPLGSANNPSNINALMLAWIKQGAKNN